MSANFEILESQLSETEMALLMAINVTMNATILAGAPAKTMIAHLDEHEKNYAALGKKRAENITAVLKALVRNTAGLT